MTHDDVEALKERIAGLEKLLTQRFSRSSSIEEQLIAIGIGKRDLPTREECREWGLKLGIPDEYREKIKMKREADPITMDHIIELRREIRRLEKLVEFYTVQADNSSRAAYDLFIENNALKHKLKEHHGTHATDQ